MRYAIDVPPFGVCADPRVLADLAREAEAAGWDGFFTWDHVALDWPESVVDTTVALTAIALATERIRFGALVTPLPRRRPAKLARETVTLDRLSGGRLLVGAGLGIVPDEFAGLGEAPDLATRAEMLDEGLEVLAGLWAGDPADPDDRFSFDGAHYQVRDALFWPKPVQKPRIPVWLAGTWPTKRPFRRAARWDGVVPLAGDNWFRTLSPDEVADIAAYVRDHRADDAPFDIAVAGGTPGNDPARAAEIVAAYEGSGLTWWLEDISLMRLGWDGGPPGPVEAMRERIREGPPEG